MAEPVAVLSGVSKWYGAVQALRDLPLALGTGELVALLGANGAGKTTAVRLLLGLSKPTAGTVRVFGRDPRAIESRRRVGAMLQVAKVPETLKVREHLALFASYYPRPLPLAQTVEAAGLGGLENRLFGELSGGQRQRLLFALALCGDPELLFLDEPTVGLDVEARRAFWEQIRNLVRAGRTILLTTHYLEEADALADRVVVLHRGGVIADGTPAEIKRRAAGKRVRCRSRLSAAEAAALPGVSGAREERGVLELLSNDADALVRVLLARDPELRELEVSGAGLEDAFLALTAKEVA
jgi:ABC-2 type transport system ATP-binding protein